MPGNTDENQRYSQLAQDKEIDTAINALEKNGIKTYVVENGEEAKKKALELIPEGAEVMNNSSTTLQQIGLDKILNESGKYNSVRNKLIKMDAKTQQKEMKALGAAPDWSLGSVHAITQKGQLIIASASGSQLPSYSYSASHVLWIAGTQKIVKDLDDGFTRIYTYVFSLEDKRALKVYGSHSGINKLLIINKEGVQNRLNLILVKEKLGF